MTEQTSTSPRYQRVGIGCGGFIALAVFAFIVFAFARATAPALPANALVTTATPTMDPVDSQATQIAALKRQVANLQSTPTPVVEQVAQGTPVPSASASAQPTGTPKQTTRVNPTAPAPTGQVVAGVYDLNWVRSLASSGTMMETLMNTWMTRTGDVWRAERNAPGTYDIPANSIVFGSPMNAGNDPAFEQIAPEVYYTAEGGRFGATEAFRAFQLDGAYHGNLNAENRPDTIDEAFALALAQPDYGKMITALDVEWSSNPFVINRWGSSGPLEVLTAAQISTLGRESLQDVVQVLPGNTIVWGELSDKGKHYGLVRIAENVYATTCQGGEFHTPRGFRAMQFPPLSEDSVIPDMDGCLGDYPVLNPENPRSAAPLR